MSTTSTTAAKAENSIGQVQFLTITALFIALTYVLPHSSMSDFRSRKRRTDPPWQRSTFHLRDFIWQKSGALAGGIGMGLFDLLSGWTAWAPFTFVIVAIMGYVVGAITEKHHGLGFDALAIVAACVIKVVGYYIAEGIIYGNWIAPFTSIPGNLVQIGVAAVVVLIVIEPLRKAANKIIFK